MLRISPHFHRHSYYPAGNLNSYASPSRPNTHAAIPNGNIDSSAADRNCYGPADRNAAPHGNPYRHCHAASHTYTGRAAGDGHACQSVGLH